MKFIDEKGRLFGKLNLIDLLVILLVVALVAAVLWKTVGDKATDALTEEEIRVTYTVLCEDVPMELCEFAQTQVGEPLLNNAKTLDATILSCSNVPMDASDPDGHQALSITIEAAATTTYSIYKVASQEVRVGYEYNVKTPLFELAGVISNLEVVHG